MPAWQDMAKLRKGLISLSASTMLVTGATLALVDLNIHACFSSRPATCQTLDAIAPLSIWLALLLNPVTFLLGLLATGRAHRWGWFAGVLLGMPLLLLVSFLLVTVGVPFARQLPDWLAFLVWFLWGTLLPLPPFLAGAFGLAGRTLPTIV